MRTDTGSSKPQLPGAGPSRISGGIKKLVDLQRLRRNRQDPFGPVVSPSPSPAQLGPSVS
ncbi:MAG: hypothetical protein AB1611_10570 [bacterium]